MACYVMLLCIILWLMLSYDHINSLLYYSVNNFQRVRPARSTPWTSWFLGVHAVFHISAVPCFFSAILPCNRLAFVMHGEARGLHIWFILDFIFFTMHWVFGTFCDTLAACLWFWISYLSFWISFWISYFSRCKLSMAGLGSICWQFGGPGWPWCKFTMLLKTHGAFYDKHPASNTPLFFHLIIL